MRVPARPRVSAAAVTGWWYIALFMAPAADARRHGNRPFTHSRRRPLHAPAAHVTPVGARYPAQDPWFVSIAATLRAQLCRYWAAYALRRAPSRIRR